MTTAWTPTGQQIIPGGPKPVILSPEMEFDVREILGLNDGDTVLIWPDTSGQGNDAVRAGVTTPSFVVNGWTFGIPAVRLQDVIGDSQERFQFSGFPEFDNTEATFFLVFQAEDLTDGCAVLGTSVSSSPPPRLHNINVDIDGTIFFNNEFTPRLINSAPGTIVEGRKYVVSGRKSFVTGMILRVNGIEVGSNSSADARQGSGPWADASIGQSRDMTEPVGEYGRDKLIVWVSGYTSAASDAEIEEMESFLAGVFQVNLGTEWLPNG